MICKCGKYIRISTAIRSRVRTEPITITHTCGRDITITKEDVEEWTKKRMAKIRPKRGDEMIYISGGITGVKDYMDKFDKAEKILSEKYAVVNPARLNKSHKDKPWAWYMRRCLKWLCDCDSIYMLNGWEKSKGAMMEYSIAKELGLQIIYEGDL